MKKKKITLKEVRDLLPRGWSLIRSGSVTTIRKNTERYKGLNLHISDTSIHIDHIVDDKFISNIIKKLFKFKFNYRHNIEHVKVTRGGLSKNYISGVEYYFQIYYDHKENYFLEIQTINKMSMIKRFKLSSKQKLNRSEFYEVQDIILKELRLSPDDHKKLIPTINKYVLYLDQ